MSMTSDNRVHERRDQTVHNHLCDGPDFSLLLTGEVTMTLLIQLFFIWFSVSQIETQIEKIFMASYNVVLSGLRALVKMSSLKNNGFVKRNA